MLTASLNPSIKPVTEKSDQTLRQYIKALEAEGFTFGLDMPHKSFCDYSRTVTTGRLTYYLTVRIFYQPQEHSVLFSIFKVTQECYRLSYPCGSLDHCMQHFRSFLACIQQPVN